MLFFSKYALMLVASSTAYYVRRMLHKSVQMSNEVCTTRSESGWFGETCSTDRLLFDGFRATVCIAAACLLFARTICDAWLLYIMSTGKCV